MLRCQTEGGDSIWDGLWEKQKSLWVRRKGKQTGPDVQQHYFCETFLQPFIAEAPRSAGLETSFSIIIRSWCFTTQNHKDLQGKTRKHKSFHATKTKSYEAIKEVITKYEVVLRFVWAQQMTPTECLQVWFCCELWAERCFGHTNVF